MKSTFAILSIILIIISCQSTDNANYSAKQEKKPLSAEDSLFKEVVAIHDEVMPKMGKLIGAKKKLQLKIDSIENVLKNNGAAKRELAKKKYVETYAMLDSAENGMNTWMEQFDWEKKMAGKTDLIQYYKDQQQKASKMKNELLAALDSAATL